jgi:hypothetical protein
MFVIALLWYIPDEALPLRGPHTDTELLFAVRQN